LSYALTVYIGQIRGILGHLWVRILMQSNFAIKHTVAHESRFHVEHRGLAPACTIDT